MISFRFLLLCLSFLSSISTWAQKPFYTESFGGSNLPTGWESSDVGSNASNFPLLWEICSADANCAPLTYGYYLNRYGDMPFGKGGYAFAASDAVPLTALQPHSSRLTSASIDCSEADEVWIRFQTHIGNQHLSASENAILRVSNDGISWEEFDLFPQQGPLGASEQRFTPNPVEILLNLSDVAAGQTTVFLQWQWVGYEELSWCIDEVELFDQNPDAFRIVWGSAPGEGDFDNGLNGWSVNVINPGLQGWVWEAGAYVGNALTAPNGYYLASPSAFNGAAIINTDFYLTGGTSPPQPPFSIYHAELISPGIDLSNATRRLVLQFYQVARLLNAGPGNAFQTSWAYSLNDGATWSQSFNVNEGLGINSPWPTQRKRFYLPDALIGEEAVRIKFTFNGNLYGWGIDDVVILERPDYDVQIANNFYAISPNLQTPVFAVEPLHFLADIWNRGEEMLELAKVYVEVEHLETGNIVFLDSLLVEDLAPDTLFENLIFPNTFDVPQETARYRVVYRTFDESFSDSTVWYFEVSESTFARENGATGAFAPIGSNSYRYGNSFYIPSTHVDLAATAISFQVGNASQLSGQKVNLTLNRLNNLPLQTPLEILVSEYTPLLSIEYTFLGFENNLLITVPLTLNGETIVLSPETHYFVVLEFESLTNNQLFISVSETYDFLATYFLYDSLHKPRHITVLDIGNTGEYQLLGLGQSGFSQIPVIRLEVEPASAVSNIPEIRYSLHCWPNPSNNTLNIQIPTWGRRYRVYNAMGILQEQNELQQPGIRQIDVSTWSNGLYLVEVFDGSQRVFGRFTVQH